MNEHARRRDHFRKSMEGDSLAIFFSAPPRLKSNDVFYKYRQDSDFYYLTGLSEEQCILVLLKNEEILFLRERDPLTETWTGPMLGLDQARESLKLTTVDKIENFPAKLDQLLAGRDILYHYFGRYPDKDIMVFEKADTLLKRSRRGQSGPSRIMHPSVVLAEMRLIKSEAEIENLRKAAAITEKAHRAVMRSVRPGSYEYELESLLHYHYRNANAGEAYPSIVASGSNACILHYHHNDRKIQDGDLILMDAGAEFDYMNADVTRTFPASGKFTSAQKDVYSVVLEAQKKAIAASIPGNSMDDVHDIVLNYYAEKLKDLGVCKASKEEILEKELYKPYFMHRTGHWLGIDVHDAGKYYLGSDPRPLQEKMVCTVEPGLYFPDEEKVPEAFRRIGVRIEDDIIIRNGNPENLTSSIPEEIYEIEEFMNG